MTVRSERVDTLFVACVGVLVRRNFGRVITTVEASRLNGYATLADVLHGLEKKVELYPRPEQFGHVLTEAGIEAIGELAAPAAVHKVRDAYYEWQRPTNKTEARKLLQIERDISRWGIEYKQFISDAQQLYSSQLGRIRRLGLRPSLETAAFQELDDIFVRVLDSMEVPPTTLHK